MVKRLLGITLLLTATLAQAAEPFSYTKVVEKARKLADKPWQQPEQVPRFMRSLSYPQYQDIRFDPARTLWRDSGSRFGVMMMSPGLFFTHSVDINIVEGSRARPLPFQKDLFTFTDPDLEKLVPMDLGYAGIKLTYPFFEPNVANQFLVFAGASYFRGVGKHNAWGISSRGIAIDTGLPGGEEFPSFIEFWLVKPAPGAKTMDVYGLLDGPSLSGAYHFQISPGDNTVVKVTATLFSRDNIKLLGVAPLTSMFFYGENTPRPQGEWRGEVHDSDGLLIQNGASGEWLWRPLLNPRNLEMDYFSTQDVRGFGLLQRDRDYDNYQDLGARYDQRPSTWVKPEGDWGPGQVVLVQIPTREETNDNIVAFWTPQTPLKPGEPYRIGYTLTFGEASVAPQPVARVVNTFVGDGSIIGGGNQEGAYRVIVDFAGGPLDTLKPDAMIEGVITGLDDTRVLEHYVEYNPVRKQWRLSMLAEPDDDRPLSLRAFLRAGGQALTETWSYRLPAANTILVGSK